MGTMIQIRLVDAGIDRTKPGAPGARQAHDGSSGTATVEARAVKGGLAITPLFDTDKRDAFAWTITHVASGCKMGRFVTTSDALAMMKRLLALGDWTRSAEALKADEPFARAARQILGLK